MRQTRRKFLLAGAGLAATPLLARCRAAAPIMPDPLEGFHMPLEAAPHTRTFMQWPTSLAVYDRSSLAAVRACLAQIANTISQYEPVVMVAGDMPAVAAGKLFSRNVDVWNIPADDLWCRDSGPTFVLGPGGDLAVAHLRFNGWGGKQPHAQDARIAPRIAERLGLALLDTGLVGEQGGVEHDGAGTVLAHASSWANSNRNPLGEAEIGARLLAALGGTKMLWAPGIKGADITDFHIDALARFVGPGKLLIQLGDLDRTDPWSVAGHETLRILENATGASGRNLDIVRLPDPVAIRNRSRDFVASYVNFYVCNGAVIAAQFGDPKADAHAREMLQTLYPGRTIEVLDVDPLGIAGGGIHCATQQQPMTAAM